MNGQEVLSKFSKSFHKFHQQEVIQFAFRHQKAPLRLED